eukprot:s2735_g14.t1
MVELYLVVVEAPGPPVPVLTVAVEELVQLAVVVENQSSAEAVGVAPAPIADAGGTRAECFVRLAGRAAEAIWIHGPWTLRSQGGGSHGAWQVDQQVKS